LKINKPEVDRKKYQVMFFCSALKMETVCFYKTLASTDESTWRQNPEDRHPHRRESLSLTISGEMAKSHSPVVTGQATNSRGTFYVGLHRPTGERDLRRPRMRWNEELAYFGTCQDVFMLCKEE
jgi:hypothetical protein